MAIMSGALYRALLAAHIDEDTARGAAEEVAVYDARLAAIEGRLLLLTWMVGTNIAVTLLVLGAVMAVGLRALPLR